MQLLEYQAIARKLLTPTNDPSFNDAITPIHVQQDVFESYDREWRENALIDATSYVKFYQSRIRYYEEEIEKSKADLRADMVELWQIALTTHLKKMPPRAIIPPTEPLCLEPIVYYQIFTLDRFLENETIFKYARSNILAVREAYQSGVLGYNAGKVSLWWNGVCVGLVSEEEEEFGIEYARAFEEWRRVFGEGGFWKDRIMGPCFQMSGSRVVGIGNGGIR